MLSYDDRGDGPAILFIHGHPFNRSMWAPQVEALRGEYRTVAPDLRGYGQSPLPDDGPSTLEAMAADLVRLLDHLGIERACIVGLSMGGQIAMEFVRAFPERASAVVFAATFPQAETAAGIEDRHRAAARILDEGMVAYGCEMLPRLIGAATLKRDPCLAVQVFGMIVGTAPSGAAAALRGRALRRDYTESLQDIRVPALVVVGTDDAFTTVASAERMRAAIPGASLEVFHEIGHLPNLEAPDLFNRALSHLLRSAIR